MLRWLFCEKLGWHDFWPTLDHRVAMRCRRCHCAYWQFQRDDEAEEKAAREDPYIPVVYQDMAHCNKTTGTWESDDGTSDEERASAEALQAVDDDTVLDQWSAQDPERRDWRMKPYVGGFVACVLTDRSSSGTTEREFGDHETHGDPFRVARHIAAEAIRSGSSFAE